ncbi:hypothetical protein C4D60_Mb08t05330 [Musa balbisiana]|uniref:MBD domain-containing protein n=1 Tax=Musa balbisiana TaxID=52838 RepID=A0A4V4H8P4_MUSBA|nr:hypothetical protein C4D60_Mb08t05330 [Musa balbisiana]
MNPTAENRETCFHLLKTLSAATTFISGLDLSLSIRQAGLESIQMHVVKKHFDFFVLPSYSGELKPVVAEEEAANTEVEKQEAKERKKSRKSTNSVGSYAVQCGECFKWRLIPTKEEYETIRQNFIEDPWFCHKIPNLSCDDPGDIEYDNSRVWVLDKPNLPKTPPDTERRLVMRSDYSKMDVSYIMPNGKKVRSSVEVEKFLEAYPEYKGKMSVADFSFTSPKVPEEMVPKDMEGKSSSARSKRLKTQN